MELAKLLIHFERSPAIKLVRAANHSDFVPALAAYLEAIHEAYPGKLTDRPEAYLTDWSSGARWRGL